MLDLDHHHLVPRALGGADDESNLITLCRPCHGKWHKTEWALGHDELIKTGLRRAVAAGVRLGRPEVDANAKAKAIKLLRAGASIRAAAAKSGLSVGTVHGLK